MSETIPNRKVHKDSHSKARDIISATLTGAPQPVKKSTPESPMLWCITAPRAKFMCPGLFVRALKECLQIPEGQRYAIYHKVFTSIRAEGAVVIYDLSRDLAESMADKANKFVDEEQGTCDCGSGIKFVARAQQAEPQKS